MRLLLLVFATALSLFGQIGDAQKQLNIASFEKIWTTIRDKHWEKKPGGLDWQAIHEEYRPKIEAAKTNEEALAVMRAMLARLKQTHFAIFPAAVYDDVDASVGDGSAGLDTRVIGGQAVVTRVDPQSSAEAAGVKPGWQIISVNGKFIGPLIQKLRSDPAIRDIAVERAVLARLTGAQGSSVRVQFLDGSNHLTVLDLPLGEPRGKPSSFGNLPSVHVWFESKKLGDTGYVAFNMFLDLPRVMASFGEAVGGCKQCNGLIIDLRGNPGGIGGMAMGMAGWLVTKPDLRLGTMYMRDTTLNFVINPRPQAFTGPVAILLDATSASTSEIFAGGLKDLGRARIFGTRSAAAALPSVIEKLPNGDGFQYAIANYISEGGKALEGEGVAPDQEVKLTREALLAGHDPVIDAALEWMRKAK